jgi:MFS family permease
VLEGRVGARLLTAVGSAVIGAGGVILALAHSSGWEIIIAMTCIGVGVGFVYAMLAKLIVDSVAPEVTGVAMGMNTVMRTIGGVIGAQIGAALLSAVTIADTPDLPAEGGFTATFLVAGLIGLVGAVACLRIPRRHRPGTALPTREDTILVPAGTTD